MIEDSYYDYEEDYPINNGPNLKKIVFIALSVIIGIIILLVIISINKVDKNSYAYIEKQMVKKAEEYVMNNNITSDNEIYLDTQMLNFTLPDTCNLTSGVLFQDDYYKPYLSCSDYESKILNNSNKVRLNGKDVMVIYQGMTFSDPGYSSYEKVKVMGFVGKEAGVYNLYYAPENSEEIIIRKVIVIDNPDIQSLYPMIEINGDKVEVITKGSYYNDNGAVAFDKTDGDITNRITKNNLPDTSKAGEYNVSYMVQNSLGYYNSITRQVVVVENASDLTILVGLDDDSFTNKNVNIVLNIIGTNYQYTILPNGEQNNNNSFSYEVEENGTYLFNIVDKNNNTIEKEITVENILKDKPEASCTAILHNDSTTISVSPDSDIIGYRYHIGNEITSYSISDSYTTTPLSNASTNVKVDIRDVAGNENTINCYIANMRIAQPIDGNPTPPIGVDPSIGNNNVKYFTYHDVEYVVANTKNDLQTMVRKTRNTISQSADQPNCGTSCLSFAKYYATFLQKKDLNSMNLYDACNYNKLARFKIIPHATKQAAINTVYNEIINGRVAVLQVTGDHERTRRHFYTVVGYRRDKYYAGNLSEEDLLSIDAWTGNFAFLSESNSKKRTMFTNRDGYRVDVFE